MVTPLQPRGVHQSIDSVIVPLRRGAAATWATGLAKAIWPVSPLQRAGTVNSAEVSEKLFWLFSIVSTGYLVAFIYYYHNGIYLGRGYPYNTFLFLPEYRFTDFDDMMLMVKNLNPYHDHSHSSYPPFANLFLYGFSCLPELPGFLLYLSGPLIFLYFTGWKLLSSQPLAIRLYATTFLLAMSYPWLVAIDRANADVWIFIFIGLFLLYFDSSHSSQRDLSAIALGAAIAFKIFPILLLAIYLKERRWLDLSKVVVVTVLLSVLSAMLFAGGAIQAFRDWAMALKETQNITQNDVSFARMNLGLYYAIILTLRTLGLDEAALGFNRVAGLVSLGMLGIFSSAVLLRRVPLWAAATVLIALMCLYPSMSYDYRLIHLSSPLLLFLRSAHWGRWSHRVVLLLFGLLLIPKNYYILHPDVPPGDVGIASILNPALLLLLSVFVFFAAGVPDRDLSSRATPGQY